MDTPAKSRHGTGNWAARGLAAAGWGIALAGLTLAAIVLWAALLTEVALAPLGAVAAVPGTLRAMRNLANTVRQRSGDWCELAIAVPYTPRPAHPEDRPPGLWPQLGVLLADQATWRDLLWTTVDICAGWVLTLAPAGLIAWGLFGAVMPAVWHPIATAGGNNWYAFIHVTSPLTAWLSVPLGLASVALGLLAGPRLLRGYGALAHSMLAPARRAEPALRVPA